MKFLVPVGGVTEGVYGILTSPKHFGPVAGITSGLPWAADNGAFTGGSLPGDFAAWLATMEEYRATCLFVVCPDVVSDADKTIELYYTWRHLFVGWPVAFVAQDGQEDLPLPCAREDDDDDTYDFQTLFVGGSTQWKESEAAIEVIKRAQMLGKHIHIGRVNWGRRYRLFRQIAGSENFTCDGTLTRFDGVSITLAAWKKLENETNVMALW